MMRRKLLHRMKELYGATSHMMKDELIVEEHQVDGTRLLIYIDITFAILVSQVRCYCNLYLLSFIVTMYWTVMNYNSRVLIHYIEGHYYILFFVSIIGCHHCSYSAILIVFCTFKFSSMTFSLSLSFMCIGYCAIKNIISFMVFIKQLKPRIFVQCKCCYTDWSLASKVRVVGSNPGTGSFFFSFPPLLSFLSLHCAFTQVCMRVCGQGPARLSGGPSYHRLRP